MKLAERIRHCWHEVYYFFASDKGVQFALTCQEAAQQVDIGISKTRRAKLRFLLHLSLCQGCKNYLSLTQALKAAIRDVVFKNEKPEHLEQLNKELLARHSKD